MSYVASAISLPFSFNSSGGIATTKDPKKIWQDRVVIAVMTKIGERVMRPTFGTDAPLAAFESEENARFIINRAITGVFSTVLQDLKLKDVKYSTGIDNTLIFEVFYSYNNSVTESVTINTAILSRSGDVLVEVSNNGR